MILVRQLYFLPLAASRTGSGHSGPWTGLGFGVAIIGLILVWVASIDYRR